MTWCTPCCMMSGSPGDREFTYPHLPEVVGLLPGDLIRLVWARSYIVQGLAEAGDVRWSSSLRPRTMRALRGGRGTVQETAAFTSSATFFSARGLHFLSAYVTGHTSPSSRFAVSWKPSVE